MSVLALIRAVAILTVALAAALGLGACGGSNEQVVARVGATPIAERTLERWMSATAPEHVVPDPPKFTACIQRQQSLSLTSSGQSALKSECAQQYQALREGSLRALITVRQLIAEAARRGLAASASEVAARLRKNQSALGSGAASTQDARLRAEAELAAIDLGHSLAASTSRVTRAQIAGYYHAHIGHFERQELRYVELAENFPNAAAASRAKRQVEAGASLARISLHEILERFNLTGRTHSTEAGRDAIFTAPPHLLSGPIKLNSAYTIFEVTRIVPPTRQPLARVEGSIARQLEADRRRQALSQFLTAWRKRWTAATSCSPGYVVQGCKQYTGTITPEDPLTSVSETLAAIA